MARYAFAGILVLTAFVARYLLAPYLGQEAPFILFMPAIMTAGLFWGLGPSLFASLFSLVLAMRFFSADASWLRPDFHDLLVGSIYAFSALVIASLVSLVRQTTVEWRDEMQHRLAIEGELRRSEQRLQHLVDFSQNMIFLKDLSGRYLLVNRPFQNLIQVRGKEIIGKTDEELFPPEQAELYRTHDKQVLESGVSQEFEESCLQDDGIHTELVNKFPLRDADNNVFALGGIGTDITLRKRAEEEMCRAREGYADLVSSIDGIVWEAIPSPLRFVFVSQRAERLLLYPVERWTNEPDFWQEHIHPKDRAWATEFCTRSLEERKDHDFEYRMIAADGRIVWLRDIVKLVVREDGEVRLRGIMVDITQQKQMEEALRDNEERLRILAQTAVDAIISVDAYGNIVQFNHAAESIFGWTWKEVEGEQVTSLLPKRFWEKYQQGLANFFATQKNPLIGRTTELVGVRKDGAEFPVELSLSSWRSSKETFFTAIVRDITARKQAEEALRRSEEQLRITVEGASADLWTWDIAQDSLECPTIHAPFGFTGPVSLETYLNHVHPEDRTQMLAELQRCLTERSDFNVEFRVVWPDGTIGWRHSRGKATYDDGKALRLSGMSLDITKRKEAEQALRHQEELLRMTTEGASVGLWKWDVIHDSLQLNSLGYRQLQLQPMEQLNLQRFIDCIHPEDRERVRAAFQDSLSTGSDLNIEHRLLGADGQITWVYCKGHLHRVGDKPSALSGMSLDITARKRSEADLEEARARLAKHADELEQTVAERTAQLQVSLRDMEDFCYNIAHDLRAPLRGMRGFVAALEEDYGARLDDTAHLYCERIRESANRMDQLISDLLAFGRLSHAELPTQIVDLNQEIERVLAHSAEEIEEKHAEIELDKPLPKVCADPPVLDQILENLIVNAVKFVPPERQPHVHIYAEEHDEFVRIWVEDNGIGIAPEHHHRIFGAFERLHTTEAYPGTGIGLAIVQRGVEKMGGHVGVESEPGKGSRFWIELPTEHGNGSENGTSAGR